MDDLALANLQLLAGRDADLFANEIDAGDQFRDRMLDLNAGVDLDEVKVVLLVHQELARAGVVIAGRSWPAAPPPCTFPRELWHGRFGAGDSSTSF